MIGVVLVVAAILAQAPPDPVSKPDLSALRDQFRARKAMSADTVEAHNQLGLWCERNGLRDEAQAEFHSVLRLDPRRDSAWKHLGYRRHNGRWMTDAEVADEVAQVKADRHWVPILRKLHDGLHDKRPEKRDAAKAAILEIDDPRAVTALWLALAAGGTEEQILAVTAYEALPGETTARAIAVLTISGKTIKVRSRAIEALKHRKPSEYGPPLVALIRPPLRYEVTPVNGPGSIGVLTVEGRKHDSRRVYAPPSAPTISSQPGDIVTMDEFGLPQIHRSPGGAYTAIFVDEQGHPIDTAGMDKIKVGQNEVEARRAAADASRQLDEDVAAVEAINASIKNTNDRAIEVLEALTRESLGTDPKAWKAWLAKVQGNELIADRGRPKKIVTDVVTLTYQPSFSVAQPMVPIMIGSGKGIAHAAPS